jgi:hypothetical protein
MLLLLVVLFLWGQGWSCFTVPDPFCSPSAVKLKPYSLVQWTRHSDIGSLQTPSDYLVITSLVSELVNIKTVSFR